MPNFGTPAQRRAGSNRNALLAATRDRIMKAFYTGDEEALVDEIDKLPDMLGKTATGNGVALSEDDMGGMHIHLHNGATGDEPAAPAVTAPPAAGLPAPVKGEEAGGGITLESLAARLDQLEQAIAILVQGEDDGDPDAGSDNPGGGPDENSPDQSKPDDDDKSNMSHDRRSTMDRRRAAVGDSSGMVMSWQEMLQRAELLVPGMKHPTFDARQGARMTADSMCQFRRRVLDEALSRGDDAKDAVLAMIGGAKRDMQKHMAGLTCDSVGMIFNGASEVMRRAGVRGTPAGGNANTGKQFGNGSVQTAMDVVTAINEKNRKHFGITR